MDELISWLTAQLDHDERSLTERRDRDPGKAHEGPCVNYEGQNPEHYDEHDSCSRHVAAMQVPRTDPYGDVAFGLRQVSACRRILSLAAEVRQMESIIEGEYGDSDEVADPMLRALASIYSDRPGYNPSWTVE